MESGRACMEYKADDEPENGVMTERSGSRALRKRVEGRKNSAAEHFRFDRLHDYAQSVAISAVFVRRSI